MLKTKEIPMFVAEVMRVYFEENKSVDGCWEWKKSKNVVSGYGQISRKVDGKQTIFTTHRLAWTLVNGQIPDNLIVCHKCDNPKCFNPSHLFLGTAKDNAQDRARKGRGNLGKKLPQGDKHWSKARPLRGELNGHAKITKEQALDILRSKETSTAIAKRLGMTVAGVCHIRNGKTWAHLPR